MKRSRATAMATIQVIFGIVIFTSSFWLNHAQHETALYVFGFITVLLGIVTAVLLTGKE